MVIETLADSGREPCRFLLLPRATASILTILGEAGCQIAERLKKIGVRFANEDFFMINPFLWARMLEEDNPAVISFQSLEKNPRSSLLVKVTRGLTIPVSCRAATAAVVHEESVSSY